MSGENFAEALAAAVLVVMTKHGLAFRGIRKLVLDHLKVGCKAFPEPTKLVKAAKNGLCLAFSELTDQERPCTRDACLFPLPKRLLNVVHKRWSLGGSKRKRYANHLLRFSFDLLQCKTLLGLEVPDSFVGDALAKHRESLTKEVEPLPLIVQVLARELGRSVGEGLCVDLSKTKVAPTSAYIGAPRGKGGLRTHLHSRQHPSWWNRLVPPRNLEMVLQNS